MTVIDILLKNRGLTSPQAVAEFFSPPPPEKISLNQVNINSTVVGQAARRIKQAIKNQEKVYIYGDYDADGICSTAILWESLQALGAQVLPYIPSRLDPVRGLSPLGIESLLPHGPKLIITVDNGISAFKGCEYARKNNVDVIITDHHQPKTKLPSVTAIVHTTQLAGAGVAWFLARELGTNTALDLAALGTIADMVPLLGVNRSLVKFGLEKLQTSKRPGLKSLALAANIDLAKITPHQVSFNLAPRLNAVGRLADSLDALRLLCTKDEARAEKLTFLLNKANEQRQDQVFTMLADARKKVGKPKKLIFIQNEQYHEGLVGLVAGRLAEEFHCPAVVVAIGPNQAKGSIRSNKSFNAIATLRRMADLLMEHGGHPQAAGFTAATTKLGLIKKELEKAAAKLTKKDLEPASSFEADLELKEVNWEFFKALQPFEPFGFGNPLPIFRGQKAKVVSFYPVGQDKKHLKLKLDKFPAIAFGQGALAAKLKIGQSIDILYSLEQNNWNNHQSLELKIKELIMD